MALQFTQARRAKTAPLTQATVQQAEIANELRAADMQREAQEQSNYLSAGTTLADAGMKTAAANAATDAAVSTALDTSIAAMPEIFGAGAGATGAATAAPVAATAAPVAGATAPAATGALAAMGPIGWAGLAALGLGLGKDLF